MLSTWNVNYKYRKNGSTSWTSTSTTVKAEIESTAMELVKSKYSQYEIEITSIKRKEK